MRNFRDLDIWKQGMVLVENIYKLADTMPASEKYGLVQQLCRAAVSVPSNIAEGCSRNSEIEYKRFLEIALGSAFELETQLLIVKNRNMANDKSIEEILQILHQEQRQLNRLITKIKNDSNQFHK